MAECQSSIRSYCGQGDDPWGIRPSTSRKGYLLVSLPYQQDIGFMPKFFSFQNSLDIANSVYTLHNRGFQEMYKRYICGYISGLNEVPRNFISFNNISKIESIQVLTCGLIYGTNF